MHLSEVSVQRLRGEAGCIDRIYAGDALGVVVRGFVTPAQAQTAAATVPEDAPRVPIGAESHAYTVGQMLAPTMLLPSGPSLDDYLDTNARWSCMSLFEDDLEARLAGAFTTLAGVPARVPRAEDGRRYAPATLHVFPSGSGAPRHCDRYTALACQAELRAISDALTQISWYLVLVAPPRGGALAIYGAAPTTLMVQPQPGDLLLFDGARYEHEVLASEGAARVTLGGFARRSADRAQFWFWG